MRSASLQQATGDPSVGLFNSTAWTIGQGHGLQPWYSWGLYGVCGYPLNNTFQGGCSNTSLAHAFTPFDVIVNDTPTKYNFPVTYFISNSNGVETFINSGYFTSISHVAFYPLFIATIAVALAFFMSVSFPISISCRLTSFLQWTIQVYRHICDCDHLDYYFRYICAHHQRIMVDYDKESQDYQHSPQRMSSFQRSAYTFAYPELQNQNIALNITVSQGNGPLILWAVFALLIISLFPYFLV